VCRESAGRLTHNFPYKEIRFFCTAGVVLHFP
jgi:hypothetical protein